MKQSTRMRDLRIKWYVFPILLGVTLLLIPATRTHAAAVTIFQDDGSGFNPVTGQPNAWTADDPAAWTIGGTVQDIANQPAYQGSQAAADMVGLLGASNEVISLTVEPGEQKSLWLAPFEVTPMVGDPFQFAFHQSGFVAPTLAGKKGNITMIFDNFEIAVDDQLWLWADMWIIQEFLVPVPIFRLAHSDNGKTTSVFEGMFELQSQLVFIAFGSVHFHTGEFPDIDRLPGVLESVFIEEIPEPATLSLVALGGLMLVRRRRCGA